MAKSNPLDRRLAALYSLEDDPVRITESLPPFLQDKSPVIIAKAANLAIRMEASGLTGDLIQVFLPILRDAQKRDPACTALTAIAKALVSFDAPAAEAYFAGLRHFQWEPGFGRANEVAGELRGLCARGIVRMGHPDALLEILPLLTDTVPARIGGIRAIAETGKPEAELLLRLHVMHGDDGEVLGECFTALLGLVPQRSLGFVAGYLRSSDETVAEIAALALGESRLTAAFPVLRDAWDGELSAPVRRSVLFAVAMLRRDEALDWLVKLLREGCPNSPGVIAALAVHKGDAALRERVFQAIQTRGSSHLEAVFQSEWR